jgi:8-oxo-dGTP pyrophosphatase MutT (NUDIX family)
MTASDTPVNTPADAAELRRQAARVLFPEPPSTIFEPGCVPEHGDHALNRQHMALVDPSMRIRPAAVLVPIVARPEGLTVLLTQRTDHLPSHAGQVAFPGGKIEPGDASPVETALREAEEEIGLERRYVEVLGYLDLYQTGSGYRIVPVVSLVRPGFALRLDRSEVADQFEVPLAFLLDAANHQLRSGDWKGRLTYYYAMPYGERYIWGATAGILRNLYERLLGRWPE